MSIYLKDSPALKESGLNDLVETARHLALINGLSLKPSTSLHGDIPLAEHVPFTLFPSIVPRHCFQLAIDCMPDFNTLIHRVAHDHDFLENALRNVLPVDEFTRRLWEIYATVRKEGIPQAISCGLFRNDFMMTSDSINPSRLKQIELNTVAVGLSGLITSLSKLHRYAIGVAGIHSPEQIPVNEPVKMFAQGLLTAWELYGRECAVILFLVHKDERYIYDQRTLQFKIKTLCPSALVIRRTLHDVHKRGILTSDKRLYIDGYEVAVAYLRTGYSPKMYPTNKEWDARLTIERSLAIKCPSIQYHLAGTKKIQQELAKAGSVERFIKDKTAVGRIRDTFVNHYSLDLGKEGEIGYQAGINHPELYVMKPQREGGWNNLFEEDIRTFLAKHKNSNIRNSWVLMERIWPDKQENYLVPNTGDMIRTNVTNELGVFGVYIGDKEKEIVNTVHGHMMRTRPCGLNEGSVSRSQGCLDTAFLVDTDRLVAHR